MLEDKYLKLTNTLYKIIGFFPEEDPLKNKTKEKALEVMEGLFKQNDLEQVLKDIDVLKGYLMVGKSQGWIDNINFLILAKEYDKMKEEISEADQVMQRDAELVERTKPLLPIDRYEDKEIPFTPLEVNKSPNKYKENEPLTGFTENKEKKEKKANPVEEFRKDFSVKKSNLRSPVVKFGLASQKDICPNSTTGRSNSKFLYGAGISQNPISERQKKILEILKKQKKAQVGDLKKVFSQVSKRTLRRDLGDLLKKKMVVRTGEWNEVFYNLS